MEFKYRAVKPTATSHSLSLAAYLPDPSLQMDAALRRALEKEQIRREILRRMELEEEVRRELEIERELGISIPRPLNIQGLVSQWLNSTKMNPLAVGHIGASSQPQVTLPSSEKEKVIVLARPDPKVYNAKRKATVLTETEACAFGLKKKLKEEWSCSLCEIKATSESGLNAHLNGKKHKMKEARQNKMICKSYRKSEKIVNAKTTEIVDSVIVDKTVNDSKKHEQLMEEKTPSTGCSGGNRPDK